MTSTEVWDALWDRWKMTHFGAAILKVHKPGSHGDDYVWCYGCSFVWPCQTIEACMESVDLTLEDLK